MIKMSTVYAHIHQFLKENKQVQKIMQDFKSEYSVDMFDNVKALVNMSVNGDITKRNLSEETSKLRGQLVNIYKNISPDYANVVNMTLDHLKKFYGNEVILKGEERYKMSDAIAKAEEVLGKNKEDLETF